MGGTTGSLKGVEQNCGHMSELVSALIQQREALEHISFSPAILAQLAGAKLVQVNGFCSAADKISPSLKYNLEQIQYNARLLTQMSALIEESLKQKRKLME